MTFEIPPEADSVAHLLPAYLNGTLDAPTKERVQRHLADCEACRSELAAWESIREAALFSLAEAPLPSANILSQVWEKIDTPSEKAPALRPSLQKEGIHFWLVLKRQVPLLPKSIWIASTLIILLGCILTLMTLLHTQTSLETSILALMTTISAAASVAFIYGAENDAGFELTLATPTSIRLIMLCRLLLVVGYNFALAACASAMVALVHGGGFGQIVQTWLGPMLLLSSITLTLSLLLGSWFALFIGLILEASQALLINFERHVPVLEFAQANVWQTNPTMLLLAVMFIVFAVLYAPRQPRLNN